MAEYVVELPELEVACDFFIYSEYPYFQELREAFLILKFCGCRPMEIFEIERWTWNNDWSFTLVPQKNNLQRSVTLGTGCESFRTCVQNQIKPFLGRTYSQLQGLFYKLCPWRPIYSGDREITLYVYRYFFVKSLISEGLSYTQVAELMGHRTETPVYLYANAVLTSTYEIPVTPTDPYPIGHIDYYLEPTEVDGFDDTFISSFDFSTGQFSAFVDVSPLNTASGALFNTENSVDYMYSPGYFCYKSGNNLILNVGIYFRGGSAVISVSKSIPLTSDKRIVFTLDWTNVGNSGGSYRNIYLSLYTKSIGNFTVEKLNYNLQYSWDDAIRLLARRQKTGNPFSQFSGTVNDLLMWSRILSSVEIQSLFNL